MLNQKTDLASEREIIWLVGTEQDQKARWYFLSYDIMLKHWKKQSRLFVVSCDHLFGDWPVSEAGDETLLDWVEYFNWLFDFFVLSFCGVFLFFIFLLFPCFWRPLYTTFGLNFLQFCRKLLGLGVFKEANLIKKKSDVLNLIVNKSIHQWKQLNRLKEHEI